MNQKNNIFKLAIVEQYVSFLCSILEIGDRIPPLKEIAKQLDISIGMIQKAFSNFEKIQAVVLEKKGHCGTFLVGRSLEKLYQINQRNPFFCALPLPYTIRYEELATSIELLTKDILPCYFMHTRGASLRIKLVETNKADMCIISKFSFECSQTTDLEILYNYGNYSYLEKHVIVIRRGEELSQATKIGIDFRSYDQLVLSEKIFDQDKYQFINSNYHILIDRLINGEIDATILNVDEDRIKALKTIEIDSEIYPIELTEAVIVSRKDNIKVKQFVCSLWKNKH